MTLTENIETKQNMILRLVLTVILFSLISCRNDIQKAIDSSQKIRNSIGLKEFYSLKQDSIFDISIISEEYVEVYRKTKNKSNKNFYQVCFLSNPEKNFIKALYLKSSNGSISVVAEEDKYLKNIDSEKPTALRIIHNYFINETFYLIDSLPPKKIIERNNLEIAKASQKAKEDKLELCGTSAAKIQERDYPNLYNALTKEQFYKLKSQYE